MPITFYLTFFVFNFLCFGVVKAYGYAPVYIRINLNTDVLAFHSANVKASGKYNRPPGLSVRYRIRPGINKMKAPYGGNIALVSCKSSNESLAIEVSNVIEAPYFNVEEGTYSVAAMEEIKSRAAPWAVIKGKKVTLVIPAAQIQSLVDPLKLMTIYDQIVAYHHYLWGYDAEAASAFFAPITLLFRLCVILTLPGNVLAVATRTDNTIRPVELPYLFEAPDIV